MNQKTTKERKENHAWYKLKDVVYWDRNAKLWSIGSFDRVLERNEKQSMIKW